jgi:hypothetical protein
MRRIGEIKISGFKAARNRCAAVTFRQIPLANYQGNFPKSRDFSGPKQGKIATESRSLHFSIQGPPCAPGEYK